MFNVLECEKPDSEMFGECSSMFDVIVAIDSCMICGVLSCGSVFDQKEDSLR